MPTITPSIQYTARDFASIKERLINHAKTYYPDTYNDFSEASIGSLLLDEVAYVGDILSYSQDFNLNESDPLTAIQYNNVVKAARRLGYRLKGVNSSTGICAFYVKVPAAETTQGPNTSYIPILENGTVVKGKNDATFTLIQDINFADSDTQVIVAETNTSTGAPTYYALKKYGVVVSGQMFQQQTSVGTYERFARIRIDAKNVSEVVSVVDSEGNEYYEVENLSQAKVMVMVKNDESDSASYILKEKHVPRRFMLERDGDFLYLVFGSGTTDSMPQPKDVILNQSARDYISDTVFDPSRILESDKFGIAPFNTILTIKFRANSNSGNNASIGGVSSVVSSKIRFVTPNLASNVTSLIVQSVEVDNEEAITGGELLPNIEDFRQQAIAWHSAQSRAVTSSDYKAFVKNMDSRFGKIHRCNVVRDNASLNNALNIYVVSLDQSGVLVESNQVIKSNLKKWIENFKMINDNVNILDAKVVNIGVRFTVQAEAGFNKNQVLADCMFELKRRFSTKYDVGEQVQISEIYKLLNKLPSVNDVKSVTLFNITDSNYSQINFDIEDNLTMDKRTLNIPEDTIVEIKYPSTDIIGGVI